jgi:hypothetical protein
MEEAVASFCLVGERKRYLSSVTGRFVKKIAQFGPKIAQNGALL